MKALHVIAFILVVIGGLNWLLVGLFGLDVVMYLGPVIAKIVYILVGLSAIYLIFTHKKACRDCVSSSSAPAAM
jgi:uncharacterized membrane protein YuzA (DUF378 family)